MESHVYRTITSRAFELSRLSADERGFLASVLAKYRTKPEWSRFASWWIVQLEKSGLSPDSPVYRICQDLEARLGISQNKVEPPDYRDFLADLIEERYGSRYNFCKQVGVDPGHLSRVFANRSDLSLASLGRLLQALGAVLVVQPEDTLRASSSLDEASRALAALKP